MLSQSSVQSICSVLREELSFLNSIRYVQRGVISRLDRLSVPNTRYGEIHFASLNKYKSNEKKDRTRFLRLSDTSYNLKKTARWGVTVYNSQDLQRVLQCLRRRAQVLEETVRYYKIAITMLNGQHKDKFEPEEYDMMLQISRRSLRDARMKNKKVAALIKDVKKELQRRK